MINRIATDAVGRWAVTASDDKTARVWEVETERLLQVLRPPQGKGNEGKLAAVALSPDGRRVAVGGWTEIGSDGGHAIYLFDRADERLLRRLTGLPNVILHLAFSPDGRWLAAALACKNGVRVFDAKSGAETGRDTDYGADSYSADSYSADSYSANFSPDERHLVTTSDDGQVRLNSVDVNGKLGRPRTTRPAGGKEPCAASFSPDGRLIALGF
jgi:WD40 repeat protein